MYKDDRIVIGQAGDTEVAILPRMANRHGIVAGATGTGKTTTVKALAKSFSDAGVPVFMADVKGDLGGMSDICPVNFWDVYGEAGLPLRTTVTEMGPILLSRILGLTDIQSDVLKVLFRIADDEGLLLIDTKDLRSFMAYVSEDPKKYASYGNIAKQSLSAMTRAVVAIESEGGDTFFGEPALNLGDWICTDNKGMGYVQVLDCRRLIRNPVMYSTFMLWMLTELFESLPEVGDPEKPKAVFFFDEAHTLFSNAPKYLMSSIEQTVKLIRSKGIGLYFISQSPADIPDGVLSQLGNKIQHALHAYTPTDQKAAKAAASSYRVNPAFDTYEALTTMGVGEALVSVLDENGAPTVVERVKVDPGELTGAIDDAKREQKIRESLLYTKYTESYDRDSAYEFLERRNLQLESEAQQAAAQAEAAKKNSALGKEVRKAAQSTAKTTAGTVGRQVGNVIGSSVGGKFGKTLGGNVGAALGRNLLGILFKK